MAKYQISCEMSFDLPKTRDEIFTYLYGKKALALIDKGDSLTIENSIDGTFRVACNYRLTKEADQKEIDAYLATKKSLAKQDVQGFIEKHLCKHDEGNPCEKPVVVAWGGEMI